MSVEVATLSRGEGPRGAKLREGLRIGGVLLLALGLRLWQLESLPYWFDESFSLRMAEYPLRELVVRCTHDTHPPASFVGLKLWTLLWGDREGPARLSSTLWSLGAVACAYGFTRAATSPATTGAVATAKAHRRSGFAATVAAAGLALSPLQITWAQQVRMYSAVACVAILSTWLLWRACLAPQAGRRWGLFAVVELLGLYLHVTMLFVFVAHAMAVGIILLRRWTGWRAMREQVLRAGVTFFAVGLLTWPWVMVVRGQHDRVRDDFWSRPLDGELLGEALVRCFTVSERPVTHPTVGLWIAQGAIVVLVVMAAGRSEFDLLVSLSAGLPVLLLIAVSYFDRNIIHPRYFIAGSSLLCVAVGVVLSRVSLGLARWSAAGAFLGGMALQAADYHQWRAEQSTREGLPQLIRVWSDHAGPEERLVFNNPRYHTTARLYAPDPARLKIYGARKRYPFFMGTAITRAEDYVAAEEIRRAERPSLWVCDSGRRGRGLEPVEPGADWTLAAEMSFQDYSGQFLLRRYDRWERDGQVWEQSR